MCLWSPLLHGFQSGDHYANDGTRVHLTVEVIPCRTRWEWLAWIARSPSRCRHGYALSAASARRLAEDAAVAMDRRLSSTRTAVVAVLEAAHATDSPERRRTARSYRPLCAPGHATPPGAAPGRRLRPPRR